MSENDFSYIGYEMRKLSDAVTECVGTTIEQIESEYGVTLDVCEAPTFCEGEDKLEEWIKEQINKQLMWRGK